MDCPSCGASLAGDARFCSSCGHAVVSRSDERRVVTVVFADIVGFTAFSESLDPEAVKSLVDTAMDRLAADIVEFGGRVDKILGDGILALFGTPVTNEDDAERAVRAALAMQTSIQKIAHDTGHDVQLRIGVNTGEVLVGDIRADGATTAMGDVVNTASRLQGEAAPGTVVVGPSTFEATAGDFVYGPAKTISLSGREETVDVRVPERPVGLPGHRNRLTVPLVGRRAELELIRSTIDTAYERSRAQIILVLGEAGVGKTRLADELERHVKARYGAFTMSGRCVPYGEANAWFPLADGLRRLISLSPDATAETAKARLEALVADRTDLPEYVDEGGRMLEAVMHLLGFESELASADPVRAQNETVRAVRVMIEAQATGRPVLLRLTDLHWADEVILNMLDTLLRRLSRLPLVVVATARHALTDRWVPRPDRHNTMALTLDALDDDAASKLLDSVLPEGLAADQREALLSQAGGNPLFIEEMAAMVRSGDGVGGGLPSNLQGLIGARIDRLDERERSLLEDAAVLGRAGSFGALERMSAAMRGSGAIEATFQSLVAHDLVEQPSDQRWRFRSELVRDVVYGRLTKTERAQRHFGVAAYIEAEFGPNADVATMAHHLRRAAILSGELGGVAGVSPDVRDRALELTRRAAEEASRQGANASALRLLEEAADFVDASHPSWVEIALDKAKAHIELRQLAEARTEVNQALALADAGLRPDLVARATLRLGEVEQWSGDYEMAESLIGEAAAGFAELADRGSRTEALVALGQVQILVGKTDEAGEVLLDVLAMSDDLGDLQNAARARQNLAWLAFVRGDAAEAEQRIAEADAIFAELGDTANQEWLQGLLAFVRMHQGRLDEAQRMAEDAVDDARARGDKWAEGMLSALLASTYLWTGRTQRSVAAARDAVRLFGSIDDVGGMTQATAILGRCMIRAGMVNEGLRVLRSFAAQVENPAAEGLVRIASTAAASAEVSVGNSTATPHQLTEARTGLIGQVEEIVAAGFARLQSGDAAGARSLLEASMPTASDGDNPNLLSALAFMLSATGAPIEEIRDVVGRVAAAPQATYLDVVASLIAAGLAAARENDLTAIDAAFTQLEGVLDPTEDLLSKALAALAKSLALAAVGSAHAVAASNEAEARLEQLGIAATGWRTAYELAILGQA